MIRWSDFEREDPVLAAAGREGIERHGFMLLGTIRRDGTPRISPIEVRILAGELVFNLMDPSAKLADIRRDPRVLLHSPMLSSGDPNSELKLRGRAVAVDDPSLRGAAALWEPPPEFECCRLDLESAALVEWSKGERRISRWAR